MDKIHLVKGQSGEWEDKHQWIECAFIDKEIALKLVNILNKQEDDLIKEYENFSEKYSEHYDFCQEDDCDICNKISQLSYAIQEPSYYSVESIDVVDSLNDYLEKSESEVE